MGAIVSVCAGPRIPSRQADFLSLSHFDIARLSLTFRAIKRDKNGYVEISNVLKYFKMSGNVFMENMFNLLNREEEKDLPLLSFEEFVYLTWNYASCDNLAFLAFSAYDTDRQNDLNADEADQISRDICGNQDFSSLKNFVPMKFTGINNSFYSQFLKSNSSLLERLTKFQDTIQEFTLGKVRWKALAAYRGRMSQSSSFIDLYDVLKLMAVRTGSKRDFLAISRHMIIKDDKRKNTRKVTPSGANTAGTNTVSRSGSNEIQLSGYSEPMQRWIREKMSDDYVKVYHPVYRSQSCDYEDENYDADGELKSFNEHHSAKSVTDSSVKSEMGRLERKLKRQNSVKSNKSNGEDESKMNDVSAIRRRSLVIPLEDDDDSSDSDAKDFVNFNSGVIGTPYRRHEDNKKGGHKRYSM
mmetsp:Transcript_11923/g.19405  ORF Transcript_11923/g.19405 Transcript_11923/m.19405 type:complete len:412 (-) Transcript_11923:147-1382(-)|eukprot:CAMPEP_0114428838 /NCGR_PEP_ID=MMETSP0103-20121206/9154_1 /TAXON_ID=37642 ORGANISM="Paraphysomonas imperforata, Strain PA2" /NCGR_SAMPLE_ID=MMETSP0103 /ASSEMBLY_ACC=CAM_ASM_000201 /LENGTH=411 /DNA_ID=CAMNT_0001598111 /DNA_START=187 /DNA_END=1422 /DNA_ORIENTATION=-